MKTQEELRVEIAKLSSIKELDENGLVVRLVTLIALEWAYGKCPVAPSDRLKEVTEEMTEEIGGDSNGSESS